jgi:hypothetical protein
LDGSGDKQQLGRVVERDLETILPLCASVAVVVKPSGDPDCVVYEGRVRVLAEDRH